MEIDLKDIGILLTLGVSVLNMFATRDTGKKLEEHKRKLDLNEYHLNKLYSFQAEITEILHQSQLLTSKVFYTINIVNEPEKVTKKILNIGYIYEKLIFKIFMHKSLFTEEQITSCNTHYEEFNQIKNWITTAMTDRIAKQNTLNAEDRNDSFPILAKAGELIVTTAKNTQEIRNIITNQIEVLEKKIMK